MLSTFAPELRQALGSLRRDRRFAVLAVSMLTVGIGANVAIFSVFASILLRPLPFADPDRLVAFTSSNPAKALTQPSLSVADFRDLHERTTVLETVAACRPEFVSYAPGGGSDPAQLIAALVTEDFFRVLGVPTLHGRHFHPGEYPASAPRTAVLSFACWHTWFGGTTDIIGRTVILNHEPTTIVGIMPQSFREPEFVELWLPFAPEMPENFARDSRYWSVTGRLKPGETVARAHAESATIAAALEKEYPGTNNGWTFVVQSLREQRTGGMRNALAMLTGAVGLVLLVACVNLANLLLARGVTRMPEYAVRLALGAKPGTLARAVLFESLLLALAGGALGAGLVALALPALAGQLPSIIVPRGHEIRVDGTALCFAISISILTGIVFGSLPAWQVMRANVSEILKAGGARGLAGGFARRVQNSLIVAQLALTLIVLAGAGLLMRSVLALQRTELGFDARDVLTLRIATDVKKWQDFTALALYYERILGEIRSVPGVAAAALNCSTPLTGITLRFPLRVQGQPRHEGVADEAVFNSVDPDYFKTLRIQLRQGRLFDARDDERAPAVCLIDTSLAKQLFPGESALGKRIQVVPWLNKHYREVIGVVDSVKQASQADLPTAQLYVPSRQSPWFFTTLVVRAGRSVTMATLQRAVSRADPTLGISTQSMEEAMAHSTAQSRLRATLFVVFGVTALGLSAFGIYAGTAFSVNQRVREIGLRAALGATPRAIMGQVLGQVGRLALWGVLAGLIGAGLLAQLLRGMLYGVTPLDPLVLATAAVSLPLVAVLSTLAPALRAARLNPVQALQHE